MRLSNPDAVELNTENRVENEVAIMNLMSAALGHYNPKVVPSVYGWGSAAVRFSQGWILQELMPGTPVDKALYDMDLPGKRIILAQMSEILSAMQSYRLPPSIEGFGGLTFDTAGRIVSGRLTSADAGPWSSYQESYKGLLQVALAKADSNPYIRGWQANGVRERVDAFVEPGVPAQFRSLGSKERKVIIHGAFFADKLLYDPATNRITTLLDYKFACILHPSYEFFDSFDGWSGNNTKNALALHDAKLNGFPSKMKPSLGGMDWELVYMWEDELKKAQVLRPRTIAGIEHVADIDAMLRAIFPVGFIDLCLQILSTEEMKVEYRAGEEERLMKVLERLGF